MDSRHKMIMVLGIALTVGAVEINKAWVSQRQDEKQAEKTVELSKQETARIELLRLSNQNEGKR